MAHQKPPASAEKLAHQCAANSRLGTIRNVHCGVIREGSRRALYRCIVAHLTAQIHSGPGNSPIEPDSSALGEHAATVRLAAIMGSPT